VPTPMKPPTIRLAPSGIRLTASSTVVVFIVCPRQSPRRGLRMFLPFSRANPFLNSHFVPPAAHAGRLADGVAVTKLKP
jgi:hypothetical protein